MDAQTNISQPPRGLTKVLTRIAIGTVAVLIALYCAVLAYMYFNQRNLVFLSETVLTTPQDEGVPEVAVEKIAMADGARLTVWTADPAEAGLPVVLYFQGQAGAMSERAPRYRQILDSGYGLMAPSYRGYSGSEGEPSEGALISDALELYDRLAADGHEVIVHGESLGSGVAAAVGELRPEAALVVLEAPYTALTDMGAERYPYLPVHFLMKDRFETRERIARISSPLLIVHGTEDQVINVSHGKRLYELASDPKSLAIMDGAGHGNLWANGIWEAVKQTYEDRRQEIGS